MHESNPVLSVIIPAFNRVEPLKLCLRSAYHAASTIPTEIILVDDGSEPPLADVLVSPLDVLLRICRQPNQGSIVARNTGLTVARGEFVQFLDSDDLVHPEKFIRQITAMRSAGVDISYTDMARYTLSETGELEFSIGDKLRTVSDTLEFFLRVQPVPHNPVYRRDYLNRHLAMPLVPMHREYDPAGDVWIYYNLLPYPARLTKVDAPLTAVGVHEEQRYSRQWERLGFAALRLVEDFFSACPATPETEAARRAAGECAFHSWRRLPRDFHPHFDVRLLTLWRKAPHGSIAQLGGGIFQLLSCMLGAELAGRLLRRLFGHSYASCRTISDDEYQQLFSGL